jgi:hypothetical protein
VPFDEGKAWRVKSIFDLVYGDICGLVRTTSMAGSMYFLLLVHNFSKKMCVYFLEKKFDAFVEKEFDRSVKSLHIENGGEFNNDFVDFCK